MTAEPSSTEEDDDGIRLNGPQSLALEALRPEHALVLAWGRGVGKSFDLRFNVCLLVALAECPQQTFEQLVADNELHPDLVAKMRQVRRRKRSGIRIIVLGPTRKQLVDIHGRDFRHDLEHGDWAWLGGKINKTVWSIEFPGGSWIQFHGMDTADSVRGQRCDVVVSDECDDILASDYAGVATPFLSAVWSLGIEIFHGTPIRGRFGLLYQRFALGRSGSPTTTTIHATYRDVPETVKASAVEHARETTPPAIFKREWECDFDAGEGLVYDLFVDAAFDPTTGKGHILSPSINAVPTEILIGVDWGYQHPGVMLELHVFGKGEDAEIYVVGETYESGRTLQFWEAKAQVIRERCEEMGWPPPIFIADPSRPSDIKQISVNAGVVVKPAKNAVEEGIQSVAYRLFPRVLKLPCRRHALELGPRQVDTNCDACRIVKRPRLFVGQHCTNLRREFGLYRRKRDSKNKDQFHDEPEKINDDAQDALRYPIFTRFGTPKIPVRLGHHPITN